MPLTPHSSPCFLLVKISVRSRSIPQPSALALCKGLGIFTCTGSLWSNLIFTREVLCFTSAGLGYFHSPPVPVEMPGLSAKEPFKSG
uniref:Uncharacterized protein n=1 Tax=Knipowitschia caucasica TaxID=637954 RepID=A0AAV2LKH8_KNICA